MRPVPSTACVLALGACAFLGARTPGDAAKVRLRLVDSQSGRDVAGIVRAFRDGDKKPLVLPGLFDRLRGLEPADGVAGWYVVPAGGAETTLPVARLRLEALSGLETVLARQDVDLTSSRPGEVAVKLDALFRPGEHGLVAGNTHLHLRGMSRADADEYLRRIPAADGLKVMFISYLERAKADKDYITNTYPAGDLKDLAGADVVFNNGEEYRHNFEGFGQGYGHVMFLGLKEFVRPASLGPGITLAGNDDRPLRPGIDDARRQGSTIVWCHNTNGHEDVPSVLTGRLDALNVFDGSRTGTYEEAYYRYLNIGLRLPLSTGTDWFLYDFSRVYARAGGPPTAASWLAALKAGRATATNGPLLTLTADGRAVGDVLALDKPATARVEARARGRHDFGRLQLVHNGKVVRAEAARGKDGRHDAHLVHELKAGEPGWVAARVEATARNEMGHVIYAHTSPVYIDLAGRRAFDVEAARGLLRQLEEGQAEIKARGKFSGPEALAKVHALYDEAARELRRRMSERGG